MVRRIVGILVEAGRGNISSDDVKNLIDCKRDSVKIEPAKFTAPPSGLFLEKVNY